MHFYSGSLQQQHFMNIILDREGEWAFFQNSLHLHLFVFIFFYDFYILFLLPNIYKKKITFNVSLNKEYHVVNQVKHIFLNHI